MRGAERDERPAGPRGAAPRRAFLAQCAAALAALGLPAVARGDRAPVAVPVDERWPARLTGAHKVVFQSHEPAEGVALVWAYNFLEAQREAYGLRDADSSIVVGLQGKAIAMFLDDAMWAKYGMAAATGLTQAGGRNPFRAPGHPMAQPGESMLDMLARRGVILLACGNTMKRGASRWVKDRPVTPEVAAAWTAEARAALPASVEVVPAMVTTLAMAQERGCRYIYAG